MHKQCMHIHKFKISETVLSYSFVDMHKFTII